MKRSTGYLHLVFPAMLGMLALTVLFSGRDLSHSLLELGVGQEAVRGPLLVWAQRAVSLLLLAVSAERVLNHIALHKQLPSAALAIVFLAYWLTTVAAPALFGSHPVLSHEYLYTLVICFAAVLASMEELDNAIAASRTALFLFLLAGVLIIPVAPQLVVDNSYVQGLMAGVPRLGGLAEHPVTLGMFAQIFLLCLLARPFKRGWINGLAWLLGLGVLFLAQSKAAWIAFFLCSASMFTVRRGPALWRRVGDPRQADFGILVCIALIVSVLALTGIVLLSDLGGHVADFFNTEEGAQLMTMTGRDKIWAVALEEWRANQVFGYGPELFDADFRASIGMLNATSGHNQFMDTLARSGTVGAAGLVLYAAMLLFFSLKYAKATAGFSIALFLALAVRSVSEVPLLLFGYGSELFAHLLLLISLAAAAGAHRPTLTAHARSPVFGVAS